MQLQIKKPIKAHDYLIAERTSAMKNEYFDGEILAMAGASPKHNKISTNMIRVLANQLLETPCSIYASDIKVKIQEFDRYVYPDILIVCGNDEYADENNDVLLNPTVIIEILSDSTEAYDRGDKFKNYQLICSLREYILVSQYQCYVEKFSWQEDNTWIYSKYDKLEDVINIESIPCELPVFEIYRKVNFSAYRIKRNRLILTKRTLPSKL